MLIVKELSQACVVAEISIGSPVRIIDHILGPEVLHDLVPTLPIIPSYVISDDVVHPCCDALGVQPTLGHALLQAILCMYLQEKERKKGKSLSPHASLDTI